MGKLERSRKKTGRQQQRGEVQPRLPQSMFEELRGEFGSLGPAH